MPGCNGHEYVRIPMLGLQLYARFQILATLRDTLCTFFVNQRIIIEWAHLENMFDLKDPLIFLTQP